MVIVALKLNAILLYSASENSAKWAGDDVLCKAIAFNFTILASELF